MYIHVMNVYNICDYSILKKKLVRALVFALKLKKIHSATIMLLYMIIRKND